MSSARNAFWVFLISVRWELAQLLISCGVFITFWTAFVCLLLSIPHAARVHNPRCSRWGSKTLPASLYIDSFTLVTSGGEGTGAFWCCWHPCKVTGHEGHFLHSLHSWWGEESLHCSYWTCFVFFFSYCKGSIAKHRNHTQEVEKWTARHERSRGWKQRWTEVKCMSIYQLLKTPNPKDNVVGEAEVMQFLPQYVRWLPILN